MPLRAGSLTHRIRIERRVSARTPSGGPADDWEPFATIWSYPIFGTGQERREAAQNASSVPATFRVRVSADTKAIEPGNYRLRCDPLTQQPRSWADVPAWDINSAVPADRDAIDIAAARMPA